jgi:hypothetical protein
MAVGFRVEARAPESGVRSLKPLSKGPSYFRVVPAAEDSRRVGAVAPATVALVTVFVRNALDYILREADTIV